MSDEQETTKKGKRPPIGGIGQYATLGGKRSDVQKSETLEVQISESLDVQTVSSPDMQTLESLEVQQSKSSGGRKSKHPDWKQQTVYLPPDLVKWLRIQAVQEDREISEIVQEALGMYRLMHQRSN